MKTYKVQISLEIASEQTAEEVERRVQGLLEYGGIRDCFDCADLDASYFIVNEVKELA